MKRRDFVTLLGGGAAGWPLTARAQPAAVPVVGYLYSGTPETSATWVAAIRKGLSETGFSEGRNVAVEYRWAYNDPARLPELAADLVRRRVAVIVTPGTAASVLAAKDATTTIPIVFRTGGDPIELGFVASLNQPGGNITGVNAMSLEVGAKRVGLLHELLPRAMRLAVLLNPNDPNADSYTRDLQAATSSIGWQVEFFGASNIREIDIAFTHLVEKRPDALLVVSQGLLINRRVQIITQASRHMLPAVYPSREWAEIGGLMSYGSNSADEWRLTGVYTGRILKGEKPSGLPVLRASKFELVINSQTAKIFDIEIPPTLLAIADEVIE
jgi:putative ABC transport system substrate-binding protein